MSLVSFFVSSGSTQSGACETSPSFYIYADVQSGQCDGCTGAGFDCYPCLTTTQQLYSNSGLTQTIGTGYYSNNIVLDSQQVPIYNTWYVVGGYPQPAGYMSCGNAFPYVMNAGVSSLSCITPSNQPITGFTQQVQYNQGAIYNINLVDPNVDFELNSCISTIQPYSGMTQRWDLIINPLTELCYIDYNGPVSWDRIDLIVGEETSPNQWIATYNYYLNDILQISFNNNLSAFINNPTPYGCYQTIAWLGLLGNGPFFPVRAKDLPTPTPTITPTITPTPTQTPLPELSINFKTVADDLQKMSFYHKQINSYGLGDTDQLSYWTQLRDKDLNTTFESPIFPLMYVVPDKVINDLRYKEWNFNCIMMDIVDRDLANQVDTLSDTLQILQDVVSQFRLSVNREEGNYNSKYYLDTSIQYTPFLEKYSDLTNGWNAELKIKTMTPLDRCAAAYNIFTGTPINHETINFKTFHDDFRLLADHHKQLNSFGFGSLEDLSYWTESRLKESNPTFESPFFPLLYVVPSNAIQEIIENGSSFTTYEFNCIVMDILNRDLANQVDVLSDTNQILDDIISQFRLSVTNSLGNFNQKYYLDDSVECIPFFEQYSDLCGGWTGLLKIKVMMPLDRCAAAFNSFIPITRTPTPTPTLTRTPTPTPSNT